MKNLKINVENLKTFGFYLVLFLLCFASVLRTDNYDFDMWARLIAGKGFVQTGHVLKYDFLSFTPTHPWYDHEWGSSVFFYLAQSNFGHFGLMMLQIILVFLTIYFLVKVAQFRKTEGVDYKNLLIYFFVLDAFMVTYSAIIRCHSFTFLFFIFELCLLEYIRINQKYKLLYFLPALFIIWTNMHGGVVSGLGLLAMYTLGEILNKKSFKHFLIVTCICPLTLFVNPYGIEYVKFILRATTMPRPEIVEWWPIFAKANWNLFKSFKVMAAVILIVELIKVIKNGLNLKTLDKTKFIILAVTLYISIMHVKMMPFFILTSVAFCYNDIYLCFKRLKFPKWGMPILIGFLIFYSLVMIACKSMEPKVDFKRYPIMEVEFIRKNHLTGNILTNFGFGSYVAYKLYPHNKIYMDGRYEEVYDDYILEELRDFYVLKNEPFKILDKYNIDIILIEKSYKTYLLLKNLEGWRLVFAGKNFAIFLKDGKFDLNNTIQPNENLEYYQKTIFNTDIRFDDNKKLGLTKN